MSDLEMKSIKSNSSLNSLVPDDASKTYEKCMKGVVYVQKLREPSVIVADEQVFHFMRFLRKIAFENEKLVNIVINQSGLVEQFVDIFAYYLKELEALVEITSYMNDQCVHEGDGDLYRKGFEFMTDFLVVIWYLTNYSTAFCFKFHDFSGTKALLAYLKNDKLVQKLIKLRHCRSVINPIEPGLYFLRGLIGTIHNLTSIADYRINEFKNAVTVVTNFAKEMKSFEGQHVVACMTLANIVEHEEIVKLRASKIAIHEFEHVLRHCCKSLESKTRKESIRVRTEIVENNEFEHYSYDFNDDWHIVDTLEALYRFALNDEVKYDLYHLIKHDLESVLRFGHDIEKERASNLLWQLCFDEKAADSVYRNKELFVYMQQDVEKVTKNHRSLRRNFCGVVWTVTERIQQQTKLKPSSSSIFLHGLLHSSGENKNEGVKEEAETSNRKQKRAITRNHVMITYNKDSREVCTQIKADLESHNYVVSMDIEDTYGSVMQTVAKTMEKNMSLLICVNQKFKSSCSLRARVEHAIKVNMSIIICILQSNFKFDAWFGQLLSDKVKINFVNCPFHNSMTILRRELLCINLDI